MMDNNGRLRSCDLAKKELFNLIKKDLLKVTDENNKITLASGKKTRYYFDIRSVACNWMHSAMIAYAYEETIKTITTPNMNKDIRVGGIESGAIPIVTSIIKEYHLNGFYVRKKRKTHGMKQIIEGQLSDYCIIVDDIVTSGGSIKQCIEAIHETNHNCKILGVFPLIDRTKELLTELDFSLELYDKGIPYLPIFSSLDFITSLKQEIQ